MTRFAKASRGAASDECKIDIHSPASLQPQGALIVECSYKVSFVKPSRHADHTHMLSHTLTSTAFFSPTYVNSECDGFILCLDLSFFKTWDQVVLGNLSCCAAIRCVVKKYTCPRFNIFLELEVYYIEYIGSPIYIFIVLKCICIVIRRKNI